MINLKCRLGFWDRHSAQAEAILVVPVDPPDAGKQARRIKINSKNARLRSPCAAWFQGYKDGRVELLFGEVIGSVEKLDFGASVVFAQDQQRYHKRTVHSALITASAVQCSVCHPYCTSVI